jgi:hypothetical protein
MLAPSISLLHAQHTAFLSMSPHLRLFPRRQWFAKARRQAELAWNRGMSAKYDPLEDPKYSLNRDDDDDDDEDDEDDE